MPLDSEAELTQPTAIAEGRSPQEWLEELAAGECDWETVFRGVLPSLTANADAGWELLAQVDQYYRRRKISADDFHGLNTHIQRALLGTPSAAAARAPRAAPPRPAEPAPARAAEVEPAHTVAVTPPSPPPPPPPPPPIAMVASRAFELPPAHTVELSVPTFHVPAAHSVSVAPMHAPAPPRASAPEPPLAAARTLVVNEVLRNRYRIRGILGHGGMGTVYAAIDEFRLDQADGGQQVAIKVLHTKIVQRPQLLAELRSEFQRLQALSHPNIVRVHEFDRDGDLTFFTMEQLSGASLTRVLANHSAMPMDRRYAFTIMRQVGEAVAYAHSRGIVHGDLNPGNIFITDDGEIRVLDFGASYRLHRDPYIPDLDDLSRTAVATPSYASCEVLQGGPANLRDDIYAMACVSYVLLTGKHPYRGQNALQARSAKLSPRRPTGISHRQWRALKEGLQFERQRRPGDLASWLEELVPFASAQLPPLPTLMSARSQRSGKAGWATAGIIALLAALCWWMVQNSDQVMRAANQLKTSVSQLWDGTSDQTADTTAVKPPAEQASSAATPVIPALAPVPAPKVTHKAATAAAAPVIALQVAPPKTPPPQGAPVGAAAAAGSAHEYHARIEMAVDTVDVPPFQSVASVVVQRRESYRNDVSFNWWTESGTAKPGRDFIPVRTRTEFIPGGDRATQLLVPIVADPKRHEARSFYVVIDEPSDGAKLGSRTITQVTIPASY